MARNYASFLGCALLLISFTTEAQNTFPASGNVGIGTTSPGNALTVVGNNNNAYAGDTASFNSNLGMSSTVGNQVNITNAASSWGLLAGFDGPGVATSAYHGANASYLINVLPGPLNLGVGNGVNMTINSSGNVGIGTVAPQGHFHVLDSVGYLSNSTSGPFGSGNAVIESDYGARTPGTGAALSFALPANTDGTNIWTQARILATPDTTSNADAHGRMYLQTRSALNAAWVWNNNLILTSDGSVTAGGNFKLTAGSGASITYQDGSVQTVAWNGVLGGGDYAESVDVVGDRAQYEPGDVLVIDPAAEGKFLKSASPYETSVMGIYSTKPGVVGRRQASDKSHMKDEVPMAMVGVVPTKVCAEGGPIRPGDLLVTSSTPGYAMKGTDHSQMMGAIIGKALGHLDVGKGTIEVAVSLQ